MPLKRRTRVKGQEKHKSSKSKDSSSEETDQCAAEEIVSRLAKKYLLKSSTDTEQSDQKENENSAPRAGDPYDADLEASEVDTAASVDTASDMECLDTQPMTPILSPLRQANVGTTRSATSRVKPSKSKRVAQRPVQSSSGLVRESPSNSISDRRHRVSRKSTSNPQRASTESVCTPKEDPALQSDSGLFISPLTNLPRSYFPKMNASDTSTPTSVIGDARSDLNDSCFGFENMTTPDPLAPISPVDHVSPTNHSALSRSSFSDASLMRDTRKSTSSSTGPVKRKVSAALDLTSLVQEEQEPIKKTRKKKPDPSQLSKMQEWAAHMAEEFQDIEMHELTIEG